MSKSIPDGYHSVTPYLIVDGAGRAIEFYKRVFGAQEIMRMEDANGRIGHAELTIGDSHIMLADEHPQMGYRAPTSVGGAAVLLMLYVDDVDGVFAQALAAGATEKQVLKDQFYGDRSGTLADPFGHIWTVATHVEDVAPAEMQRRARAYQEAQRVQ